MAQVAPSNMLYVQALELISALKKDYASGVLQTPDEISEGTKDILTMFDSEAGYALTPFELVRFSEPPNSEKMNRLWSFLSSDLNLLQDQVDTLKAASVFLHNYIKTEIMKSSHENLQLQNKLKTLELYSNSDDGSIFYLGDNFITQDFVDWNLVSLGDRANFIDRGYVGLGVSEQRIDLAKNAKIKILDTSNGFPGNNQEIIDPLTATTDPISNEKIYTFVAEINRSEKLESILDGDPSTWFEFERYQLEPSDYSKAKGYNFHYLLTGNSNYSYLKSLTFLNNVTNDGMINWAINNNFDALRLKLEIDLNESQVVNVIKLSPFGLRDNINNPIKVVDVSVSSNGTDWSSLNPNNIWIANTIDKKLSYINSENISIGSATWVTNGELVRYIRFLIEQTTPIQCNIGHLYYIEQSSGNVNVGAQLVDIPATPIQNITYNSSLPYDAYVMYGDTSSLSRVVIPKIEQLTTNNQNDQRRLGPNPPIDKPNLYYNVRNLVINNLRQKREFFRGKRWAIAIRDILVKSNVYLQESSLVSKRFQIPGVIDRVALEADIIIPSSYNQEYNWIKFFISPDDGSTWYPISRIYDDFLSIPEIIAFNDPTPVELREPGVAYYDVPNIVNSLRLKVEFTRPEDQVNSTPVLRSYKLKIVRRK